jgi:hypothetical protein
MLPCLGQSAFSRVVNVAQSEMKDARDVRRA